MLWTYDSALLELYFYTLYSIARTRTRACEKCSHFLKLLLMFFNRFFFSAFKKIVTFA